METYNDYLEHHGIKDQRWGVRNGPPYPLSRQEKAKMRAKAKAEKLKEQKKIQDQKLKNTSLKRQMLADKISSKIAKSESKRQLKEAKIAEKNARAALKIKERDEALARKKNEEESLERLRLAARTKEQIEKDREKEVKDRKKEMNIGARRLTDTELKDVLERRRLENQLREENYKNIGSGKAFVREAILKFGTLAVTTAVSKWGVQKGAEWAHKHFISHPENFGLYMKSLGKEAGKAVKDETGIDGSLKSIIDWAGKVSERQKNNKNKGK